MAWVVYVDFGTVSNFDSSEIGTITMSSTEVFCILVIYVYFKIHVVLQWWIYSIVPSVLQYAYNFTKCVRHFSENYNSKNALSIFD